MTKFYICTTNIPKGPYRLHEIDTLNISTHDLIWTDDYLQSRKAIQVPELRDYFRKKLPAEGAFYARDNSSLRQKIILVTLLCVLASLIGYYFITL